MVMLMALLASGCRRKPAPPSVVETVQEPAPPEPAPAEPAPAPAEPAVVAEAPQALPSSAPFGHAPTDDELRTKLKPLLPQLARCVTRLNPEGPMILRFSISPAGSLLAVQLAGQADECASEALRELKFEPWSGPPSVVALPLSREGKAMTQTDGGLK